jgi:hypothetical protein
LVAHETNGERVDRQLTAKTVAFSLLLLPWALVAAVTALLAYSTQ